MVEPGISNCKQRDAPKTQESLRFGNHLTTSVFWRYGALEKNKLEPYECVLGLEELKLVCGFQVRARSFPQIDGVHGGRCGGFRSTISKSRHTSCTRAIATNGARQNRDAALTVAFDQTLVKFR